MELNLILNIQTDKIQETIKQIKIGIIEVKGLRQGKVIATELSTLQEYILNSEEQEIVLGYDDSQTMTVENGDVVVVPKGYHPVGVPDGYDSYYLNIMAGPIRKWKFYNDPKHEWILKRKD